MSIHVLSWAFTSSEAKLGDRLVVFVLADHAKEDGTCAWPSVATIAEHTRLSPRQVQRCLRNLELAGEIQLDGKSKSGTNVYSLPGYIAARKGGDRLSPLATVGGDISDTGGATNRAGGGDVGVTRSVLTTTVHSAPVTHTALARDVSAAVAGQAHETERQLRERLALDVLAAWNEMTGQKLRAKAWLTKIGARVKEYPELKLADHRRLIEWTLARPWWQGPATPNVIYGTGAQFERSMITVTDAARASDVRSLGAERMRRILNTRRAG